MAAAELESGLYSQKILTSHESLGGPSIVGWRSLLPAGLLMGLSVAALMVDTSVTSQRCSHLIPGDVRRIIQLCEIFGHGFGIAIVLYMLWLLAPAKRRCIPRVAACALLPGVVALVLKLFVARRRPGFYWPEFAEDVSNTWVGVFGFHRSYSLNFEYVTQSFPSAHAATAIGLAGGLAWLFPQGRIAFFVLGLLAAFQRVFAGAHWTSDVLAGAAIGVIVCGLLVRAGEHPIVSAGRNSS